jgi:riboflavin kinase/FMN adenylyltransferase
MRVLHGIPEGTTFKDPVLTLGTFDGVHIGHQAIIANLVAEAGAMGKESVLFTFHPHPRMVIYPDSHSVRLIDSVEEKLEKLEALGLDTVILFPFTKEFSRLSAMEFVRDILVQKIGISEMRVGYDHHFGKNREGSFAELVELGELYGFQVEEIKAIQYGDVSVSSTKIRNAILEGDVKLAADYLGSNFKITGEVVHGKKLGRTIGFPTANIAVDLSTKLLPKIGVYSVIVWHENSRLHGVMNIGVKPTVSGSNELTVEVFIFDFDKEIYGDILRLECIERLRDEQKFDSLDSLKLQLKKDVEMAKHSLLHYSK